MEKELFDIFTGSRKRLVFSFCVIQKDFRITEVREIVALSIPTVKVGGGRQFFNMVQFLQTLVCYTDSIAFQHQSAAAFKHLLCRIFKHVRTVAQQKLGLYISLCTRDHELCAQLLEQ